MDSTSESIATVLMDRMDGLFSEGEREKLIAQAYDGASVMRGDY